MFFRCLASKTRRPSFESPSYMRLNKVFRECRVMATEWQDEIRCRHHTRRRRQSALLVIHVRRRPVVARRGPRRGFAWAAVRCDGAPLPWSSGRPRCLGAAAGRGAAGLAAGAAARRDDGPARRPEGGGCPRGTTHRVGPHASVLRGLRHADRARRARACAPLPGVRTCGVPSRHACHDGAGVATRRSAAGARAALHPGHVQRAGRLRRSRRDAGAVRRAGDGRRGERAHYRPALPGQPELAVSAQPDAGVHGTLDGR